MGCEEIRERHTGKNFKNVALSCLTKYEIYPKDIFAISSDNGSNLLKASELLKSEYNALKFGNIPEVNPLDEEEVNRLVEIICGEDWTDDDIDSMKLLYHLLR